MEHTTPIPHINTATRHTRQLKPGHSLEEEYLKDRNPILGKWTVENRSKSGRKSTLEGEKVQ
jgi:hypothetical protein